ncbi:orotidine-5'-phosphate decarboxylase [Planococcus lenghuensis]|uniref:Orotidine 5'-phosphate decarboxylase n=1 Tax=Planococcus lenghuensis TaxID=2213202 RepID=A0A1Q2L006_9BACL|nr:orotidine-5'-phosphate decarboxylase [Planococcus lenghuensis]AQQ53778.1 orotidine 5'-phosphate decarboxylase [Planococcus lenghuensis]
MNSPIIALDFPSMKEVKEFIADFEERLFVKVGMELFFSEGPEIVRYLKEQGHQVFLDLKLHDIPNTVESAMRSLAKLDVDLVNVHAAGGIEMMRAAKRGLSGSPVKLIAVTQLTSTDEKQMQQEQLIERSLEESVLHYAVLAKEAGLDGVVCSVKEAKRIGEVCGEDFLRVTPGIRLGNDSHDQKRTATPEQAAREGATHIVVGRAVTQALKPREQLAVIDGQWRGAVL